MNESHAATSLETAMDDRGEPRGEFALSERERAEIARAMRETILADRTDEFLATSPGRKELDDHTWRRYGHCLNYIVPWVEQHATLRGARVLEIGCGTGSSTAAFARFAAAVDGYDIVDRVLVAARRRFEILGLSNANVHLTSPDRLIADITDRHESVDAVVLYAVMEHQKLHERLETLSTCWRLLKPGGVLVVADTPNRLVYINYHTSYLPFFDMLPDELAFHYLRRSPRAGFRDSMIKALERSREHATDVLDRWGRGVSYHEFEQALGDLSGLVVGDGFDPIILNVKPLAFEEELLARFMLHHGVEAPIGFARRSIDVILRKPGGESKPAARSNQTFELPPGRLVDRAELRDLRQQLAAARARIAELEEPVREA